jgi:hypothetical protein
MDIQETKPIIHKYRVIIEGNDAHKKHFVEHIEVEAENEDNARRKANKAFIDPAYGISLKYDNGPKAVGYFFMDTIQLD